MSRPAKARETALHAARHIVRTRGVASLTLEEIARESGVTKGGVLYHFRSKSDLIRAALELDMHAWEKSNQANTTNPERGFEGHIRSCLGSRAPEVGELVAGLLAASGAESVAMARVREREARRFADWQWDDAGMRRYLLTLAAEGAFWRRFYALPPNDTEIDARLARLIESMLAET